MVCDHTKIQGVWKKKIFHILECHSFSPELVHDRVSSMRPYQNSGYWKKNWKKILKKKLKKKILKIFENFFWISFHILECHSFSPELVCDYTKIQGFLEKIEKKIWKFILIFFHILECHSFYQNCFATIPKFRGFEKEKKKFSHLRVSFFFTRIGSWPYQNSGFWKKNWKKKFEIFVLNFFFTS